MTICIIAGCSKKKLNHSAPAEVLNQGQLFRSIRKLAHKFSFDLKILSGKYGLLDQNTIIEPYNQKIKTKKDITIIRNKVWSKLEEFYNIYDSIIVIMGGNYRKVLEPFFDDKFIVVFDKRGIGGYLQLVSNFNKLSKKSFLKEVEKFRVEPGINKIKLKITS